MADQHRTSSAREAMQEVAAARRAIDSARLETFVAKVEAVLSWLEDQDNDPDDDLLVEIVACCGDWNTSTDAPSCAKIAQALRAKLLDDGLASITSTAVQRSISG